MTSMGQAEALVEHPAKRPMRQQPGQMLGFVN